MKGCILAVETSCDETAAALLKDGRIIAEQVHTQADLHGYYGGVVPELASRDHVAHVGAVCQSVLTGYEDQLDLIAATRGPGLIGGLLVGLQWAKGYAAGLPFVGVHHLAGRKLPPYSIQRSILNLRWSAYSSAAGTLKSRRRALGFSAGDRRHTRRRRGKLSTKGLGCFISVTREVLRFNARRRNTQANTTGSETDASQG